MSVVKRAAEMLAEFHAALGDEYGHGSVHSANLRRNLHIEENDELIEAIDAKDFVAIAHELADVVYVAYGTAYGLGIPLDVVLTEVHRANMSKFSADGKPLFRGDGKLLKSDQFVAADVATVLEWSGLTDRNVCESCNGSGVEPATTPEGDLDDAACLGCGGPGR